MIYSTVARTKIRGHWTHILGLAMACSLGCTRSTSSGADEAQSKKGTLGEKDRDEFGYLIEWYGFQPNFDRTLSSIRMGQSLATTVENAYVISVPLTREPSDRSRLTVLTLRPTVGQTCAEFEANVASGTFSDLTQHRRYLIASLLNYDAAENALSFSASQVDAQFPCSLFVVTEELPENAAEIGYRQLYGAIAFAFAAPSAVQPNSGYSDITFATTAGGTWSQSIIRPDGGAGNIFNLVQRPGGQGYLFCQHFPQMYESTVSGWTNALPLVDYGGLEFGNVGIAFDTTGAQEKTYVLKDQFAGGAPQLQLDVRTSPSSTFGAYNNGDGFRDYTTFAFSAAVGLRFSFMEEQGSGTQNFYIHVAEIPNLDSELYSSPRLLDSAPGNYACAEMFGAATHLQPNGDVYFAYTCRRSGDSSATAPMNIGRLPAGGGTPSQISFKLGYETGAADSSVSRLQAPAILPGLNGDIHFLYLSSSGLKMFHAHFKADNSLSVQEIDVITDVSRTDLVADRGFSAAMDAERGIVHTVFYARDGGGSEDPSAPFYGAYALGSGVLSARKIGGESAAATVSRILLVND